MSSTAIVNTAGESLFVELAPVLAALGVHTGRVILVISEFNSPKLQDYDKYIDYFSKTFILKINGERKECSVKFQFIITKDGEILEPKGSIPCIKKPEKFILKTIESTKNKWEPMLIFNNPVNTFVEVKFDYN